MEQGHKSLRVYQLAHAIAVNIHRISLSLPRFELFETGSQIRRSSKSVSALIVEGYGLRRYKKEWLNYLIRAKASNSETEEHLSFLFETRSFQDAQSYHEIMESLDHLSRMLSRMIDEIDRSHNSGC